MPLILRYQDLGFKEGSKIANSDIEIQEIDSDTFTCISDDGILCKYNRWTLDCISEDNDPLDIKSKIFPLQCKFFLDESPNRLSDEIINGGTVVNFNTLKKFIERYSHTYYHNTVKIRLRRKIEPFPMKEDLYVVRNPTIELSSNKNSVNLCGEESYGSFDQQAKKIYYNPLQVGVKKVLIHENFYNRDLWDTKTSLIILEEPTEEELKEFNKNLGI